SALALLSLLVGSIWYNTRLSALARQEERQRHEAQRQARLFRDQLEVSRRSVYALQLTHIESSLERNPGLGLALLKDSRDCPGAPPTASASGSASPSASTPSGWSTLSRSPPTARPWRSPAGTRTRPARRGR